MEIKLEEIITMTPLILRKMRSYVNTTSEFARLGTELSVGGAALIAYNNHRTDADFVFNYGEILAIGGILTGVLQIIEGIIIRQKQYKYYIDYQNNDAVSKCHILGGFLSSCMGLIYLTGTISLPILSMALAINCTLRALILSNETQAPRDEMYEVIAAFEGIPFVTEMSAYILSMLGQNAMVPFFLSAGGLFRIPTAFVKVSDAWVREASLSGRG